MTSLALAAVLHAGSGHAAEVVAGNKALEVRFDPATSSFAVLDRKLGPILEEGKLCRLNGGRTEALAIKTEEIREGRNRRTQIRLGQAGVLRVVLADENKVEFFTEGLAAGELSFAGRLALGERTSPALLAGQAADRKVLITTNGPAEVASAHSMFDPERDLAVTVSGPGEVAWRQDGGWRLCAAAHGDGALFTLELTRNYYRDGLGIQYYAPLPRLKRWPTAPVVAMTWYAIEGWKRHPAQTKDWLYPNIDWVAKHLLPYAERLVFQFDDNYPNNDDKYMRELSDYVRARGMIPGVWLAPFTVAPMRDLEAHPDWFLRNAKGNLAVAFGGQCFGWYPKNNFRSGVLSPDNAEAMKVFGDYWKKVSETWNYDFIKADGLTEALRAFSQAQNGGGVEGFRKAMALARTTVGEEKFINASFGVPPPVEAIGIVNGSRTGGDTGHAGHAASVVVRWNFLNNIAWWSDPDATANLWNAPVERARLNSQIRVLTGQQFLTDDVWTKVPEATTRVWQHSFPTLDIRPVNLYEIRDWEGYDLYDLRVARPWGQWDVVGLCNYSRQPAAKTLDLDRLPLSESKVHVYEYWTGKYVGCFPRDARIARPLKGFDGEVFAIVPASKDGRPVLLSTSRHVTQGALDLDRVEWRRGADGQWTVTGASSHLVAGDPYELVFFAGGFAQPTVQASAPATAGMEGNLARVRLTPAKSGGVTWTVKFAAREQ